MRQLQQLGVDYQIPDKQKVKIERTRRPDSRPDTTAFALDPQQSGQQRFRWRGRRPYQRAIQKTGAVNTMLGIGIDKAGHPDGSQDALETRNGEREMRPTIPEITPKRHRHGSGCWAHGCHHLSTVIGLNQQDTTVTSCSGSPYT